MKHVEKFIRHLQSSIEKRKAVIKEEQEKLLTRKCYATAAYEVEDECSYNAFMQYVVENKTLLKTLHKQQKTETEMLKWLENIRSCHEEMICAMYGDDTNLLDFSLEEEQHD